MNIGYKRTADPSRFGAVILAAGLSSRMKDFKPLLPVDGQPAVAGLAESLQGAGIRDIILVTGHRREDLEEQTRRFEMVECFNEGYEEGMFSSIRAGLGEAARRFPDKTGYFLVPVDCPLITIRALRDLMEAAQAEDPELGASGQGTGAREAGRPEIGMGAPDGRFYVPTFEGKKGHPLLVPAGRVGEILAYRGSEGLKGITDAHPEDMVRVPVADEEVLLDMDTPEGYEAIRDFVAHGFKREKLEILSSRKRIILIRHGQTRQHREPVFIGQYDVPLSEEGRAQAARAGDRVADLIEPDVVASATWVEGISLGKEPLPPIERVYCSDLQRAEETARIVADRINARYDGAGGKGPGSGSGREADPPEEPDPMRVLAAMQGLGTAAPPADLKIHVDVLPLEGLREMSLGDWDGRPIREIREEDPEGYERRGRDLFTYKTGNHSENFYDMQYRAVAALREILAGDDARNIVIVAHSGVIRALENNLKGLRVDDDWEPLDKGGCRIWTEGPRGKDL